MFQIDNDMTIYITRGDTAYFSVSAETESGVTHIFQPGDIVRMKVFKKKDCTDVAFQKDFAVIEATERVDILLTEKETKIGDVISKPVDYWYEIELNPYTAAQTIVGYDDEGPKLFKLFPEGKDVVTGTIEEDDIPVVDVELSLTSERPVQNQAIARAILYVNEELKKSSAAVEKAKEEVERTELLLKEIEKDYKTFELIPIMLKDVTKKTTYTADLSVGNFIGSNVLDVFTIRDTQVDYCTFFAEVEKGDAFIKSNSFALTNNIEMGIPYLIVTNKENIIYDIIHFNDLDNYIFAGDGTIYLSFYYGDANVGEFFYIKKASSNEPLVLYENRAGEYETDLYIGEKVLKYIMEGKQIYVRVPNADGGDHTAIYSPILMYQLPNKMCDYLYLFYLKDEKQDLSALGLTGVKLPTYGELKLRMNRTGNATPLI